MNAPRDPVDVALDRLRMPPGDERPILAAARSRILASRERRRRRTRAGAAAVVLLLAGIALGAAFEPVREWLGITIVAAERGRDGQVEQIVFDLPDGGRALMVPLDESPTAFDPRIDGEAPVIAMPREGGGSLDVRILRRGRRWYDEYFTGLDQDSDPEPGRQIRLRRVALVSRVLREAARRIEVVQTFDSGHVQILTLLPSPDDPARYGDGETLVEVAGR